MIRHVFKMMWNRKRTNWLIVLEIFCAFLVLFALTSFVFYNAKNYLKPLGFSYQDVIQVNIVNFGINNQDEDAQNRILTRLKTAIASLEGVEYVSRCSENMPYGNSTWTSRNSSTENGKTLTIEAHYITADEDFANVWKIPLVAGHWFNETDRNARLVPVVLSQALAQYVYDEKNTIGNTFRERYRVIGIVEDFRYRGEFYKPFHIYFIPVGESHKVLKTLVIRTKPGAGAVFEERLSDTIRGIAKSWLVQISPVRKFRTSYWKKTLSPVIALSVVSGFLLLNVALGIFGVLWNTITRRRPEIGLRKALGAFSSKISAQIVGEILALTTIGLLFGLLVAIQFPLLNVLNISRDIYGMAIVASSIFLYGLVVLCAFYPSRIAANIHPAIALHDE